MVNWASVFIIATFFITQCMEKLDGAIISSDVICMNSLTERCNAYISFMHVDNPLSCKCF